MCGRGQDEGGVVSCCSMQSDLLEQRLQQGDPVAMAMAGSQATAEDKVCVYIK